MHKGRYNLAVLFTGIYLYVCVPLSLSVLDYESENLQKCPLEARGRQRPKPPTEDLRPHIPRTTACSLLQKAEGGPRCSSQGQRTTAPENQSYPARGRLLQHELKMGPKNCPAPCRAKCQVPTPGASLQMHRILPPLAS